MFKSSDEFKMAAFRCIDRFRGWGEDLRRLWTIREPYGGARTSRQPGQYGRKAGHLLRTLRRHEGENFSQPGRQPGQKLFSQGS